MEYIREFVTLAECLSFRTAAERLFITQSSLSKHIQTMERELDVTLFDRTTRSIRLSEAGQIFMPYAVELLSLFDEAEKKVSKFTHRKRPVLTIAVMQNPQYYDLAKYMVGFRKEHPDLPFSMVEADEFGLYEMFRRKIVNIFPTYSNFHGVGEYIFMPMVQSTVVAIALSDHPFAGKEKVSINQLSMERLLLPTRGGALYNLIMDAFRDAGAAPEIVYEGSSVGCIDLVKAGMGVSLHSREFARTLSGDPEVVSVDIEPPIRFTYGLGHRPVNELTGAEKLYLEHMKKFELR